MTLRCAWLVLGLCMPTFLVLAQPEQAPGGSAFAFSAPVIIAEEGDAYVVPLTPSIYSRLADPELGDMRVFNGDGEAVTHGLRLAARETTPETPPFRPLALFPLSAAEGEVGAAFSVRLDGQGLQASLQVGGEDATSAAKAAARAYLVDARALQGVPMERVRLDFEGHAEIRGTVRVEVSDDLASFRAVPGPHALLRVSKSGQTLQRLELELGGVRARYLRLHLRLEQGNSVPLRGVAARARAEAEPRAAQTLELVGRRRPDAPHVVEYEVDGPVPVHAVQLRFARDNTVVPVTLRRGPQDDAAQEQLFRGTLYRVGEGAARVESPPIEVPIRRERRAYRVEFSPAAPEAGTGAPPTLRAFFAADEVVFLPRGPGPFRLAHGHGSFRADAPRAQALLEPLSAVPGARVMRATLGLGRLEAGDKALEKVEGAGTPWLLWSVLGLCVLVLFAMVAHLVRGARTKDDAGGQL